MITHNYAYSEEIDMKTMVSMDEFGTRYHKESVAYSGMQGRGRLTLYLDWSK